MVAQNSSGAPRGSFDMQRAALVRPLDPLRRQAGLLEIKLCFLQIFFGEAAHADALGTAACAARLSTRL